MVVQVLKKISVHCKHAVAEETPMDRHNRRKL